MNFLIGPGFQTGMTRILEKQNHRITNVREWEKIRLICKRVLLFKDSGELAFISGWGDIASPSFGFGGVLVST